MSILSRRELEEIKSQLNDDWVNIWRQKPVDPGICVQKALMLFNHIEEQDREIIRLKSKLPKEDQMEGMR